MPDGYELVLPFVACKSNGGPHDDAAFVAGFRLGGIRERLRCVGAWSGAVRDDDIRQLDLIVMEAGLPMTLEKAGDGWVYAEIGP